MCQYRDQIKEIIDNEENDKIIKILNELYILFSKKNEKYRKHWTPLYMFDDFVDYIINNRILYRLNEDAQQYFESYITKNCFSKPPPVYCPK